MPEINKSPRILELDWGRIKIEGFGEFKDVKLYPGGARTWNWQETGTEHSPGVQFSDVEELLEHGAEEVILTRGVYGRLKVPKEIQLKIKEKGVSVHVLRTKEAMQLYNQLCEEKKVGALFHNTC